MRFVELKSQDQLDMQSLHRVRDMGVRSLDFSSLFSNQRHEPNRHDGCAGGCTVGLLHHNHQVLGIAAERDDHTPTWLKLLDQRRGNVIGGRSDDDGIKGRMLCPPLIAIADLGFDIGVAQSLEDIPRSFAKFWNDLDRVHLLGEHR